MIKFFNTLSRKKENFQSLNKKTAKIYNCGPTVYDRQHIGNLRSAVIWDILRRALEWNGYKVKQVVNVTDFGHLTSDADEGEDKMTKGLKKEGLDFTLENMKRLGKKYADIYLEDRKKLNTLTPTKLPFASDHVKEDIELIKKLDKKGFAYATKDGIYFDTAKFPGYGKLGGLSEIKESRISANKEKKSSRDFVLWKSSRDLGWDSPWGKGFPGWHIECSAMSKKYLGETFDIHTGGIEHIPIHHNNEIAQSEAANGRPLARYWLHNEHLIMKDGPKSAGADGTRKMAKSLGNVVTLKEIEEKGIDPLALRYWLLGAHYRSPISFSWEALEGAEQSLKKLRNHFQALSGKTEKPKKEYLEKFGKYLNDDLDTPKALAFLWKIIKDKKISDGQKKFLLLEFDKVFGLKLNKKEKKSEIPTEIKKLAEEREKVRQEKNWPEADRLREIIKNKGFEIKDTEKGPKITSDN